jgi:hypothetical protein
MYLKISVLIVASPLGSSFWKSKLVGGTSFEDADVVATPFPPCKLVGNDDGIQ